MIIILAFFHTVSIRLSDKHLVYSLASVFETISSPAFNVSMFIWSLPVAVSFIISRSAASPPVMLSLVPLLGQCGLWYSVHCRIAQCRCPLFVILSYLDYVFLSPASLEV